MDVRLIQVPYMAGDDQHGSSQGPARLIAAGADRVLKAAGVAVTIAKVGRNGPFRDTASSTARINKQLGIVIRDTISIGQLPIVLSGSCVSAHGVLAGLGDRRHGAVWIDAHADFNTPDTTITGFFPGMSAAIAVGHCYPGYRAFVGLTRPLDAADIVMLGVRDLWPVAERERLHRSAIHVVPWSNGARQGDVTASLEQLAGRVGSIYLHIDFDAFAPEVAPGIVDEPVPGGLCLTDAEEIVRLAAARFDIGAVTLATYTPSNDRDDKTLRVALRMIELLGEYASGRSS